MVVVVVVLVLVVLDGIMQEKCHEVPSVILVVRVVTSSSFSSSGSSRSSAGSIGSSDDDRLTWFCSDTDGASLKKRGEQSTLTAQIARSPQPNRRIDEVPDSSWRPRALTCA